MNGSTAQAIITAMAIIGLLEGLRGITTIPIVAVTRRLATIYGLLLVLLSCRLVMSVLPGIPALMATVPMMVAAAWLPLAGIRFVEDLVRRHAPVSVKIGVLAGAVVFTVFAFTAGLIWNERVLHLLAAFQGTTLVAMVVMLIRGRPEVTRSEGSAAACFLLALVAAVPLVLTDFRAILPDADVRGGPFAVLLLLLATSRLIGGGGTYRHLAADVALCLASGAIAYGASDQDGITAAFCTGLTAFALLVERFSGARGRRTHIIRTLATAQDTGEMLAIDPLLSTGRTIEATDLAEYPADVVTRIARHRLLGRSDPDPGVRDAVEDILDSHDATHLLRLEADPPRFLALSAGVMTDQGIDDELMVAARMMESRA